MEGISQKEIEIIAHLEFERKYFFRVEDVERFAENRTQRYNIIKHLLRKERIIKLNRNKYFLVPIKAKSGRWSEHPFIIADEILEGKDYVIGGWAAAHYWRLTDQIPMQTDIWTTRRQGRITLFNHRFVFHRSTRNRVSKHVTGEIKGHSFRILSEEDARKWLASRD